MCQQVERGLEMSPSSLGTVGCFQNVKFLDVGGGEENVLGMASGSFMFCTILGLKDPTPRAYVFHSLHK